MTVGLDEVKQRLRAFAAGQAAGVSPLYEHLTTNAAEDDEVAGLLTAAPDDTAGAPLLLAAAHRLVQADPIHPLSRYYPSLGGFDGVDGGTWPLFREFLLERADKVRAIVAERHTETNEVSRAAGLFPAVALAAKQAGGKVALLEVGCSAGLLLGLDKFGYRYQCDGGEQILAGPAKAAVGLHCALGLGSGAVLPKVPKKVAVAAKVGLDTSPIDVSDEDELAWMEACVWADQLDRIRLLRAAAAAQRKDTPELVEGDAVDDLAAAAARTGDLPLVVLTSRVLNHVAEQRRGEFVEGLAKLAADRPVWWVSDEPYEVALSYVLPGRSELNFFDGAGLCTLGLVSWRDGVPEAKALAHTSRYGNRMTWLAA
ncbi:DUF2332 domain-containing protein [Amycolatopsis acidiphila]|uniref:DUF2332 domain-containing protein n=1 Tax=Amycolatopsis acidiphila TaxID=715473 RepID=A0A558A045_9PSEU|nr:DUF2332 domain-containing protein [Amycolatopsis acidiphila]TVT17632.1 DUF2332 domain-containing protein [Amycolatopsis acidiphila]UIJ60973.1 DUF2332 domain-containing protein [Amycolatopsis acidiphila]GHG88571.1 hypothetical protein GCM10017788_62900 [Amycolatopsis acidiphila]